MTSQMPTPTLAGIREHLALLSNSLPHAVDPMSMRINEEEFTRSKTPTVALCYREGQAWRFEEFTRAGCDLMERRDIVASIASARHAAECCAGVWYLLEQIEQAVDKEAEPTALHEQMVRLVVGTRIDEDLPQAINVMTFVKKIDRALPGFLGSYDRMSEIAHPNWAGSAAIFSKLDQETLITHFGKNLRDTAHIERLGLQSMMGSVEVFLYAYNRISDLMPAFCRACEQSIIRRETSSRE